MKNNKIALLPGLSLFLCFCLLTGMGRLAGRLGGGAPLTALSEAAAFLLPMVLAVVSLRDQKAVRQRLRRNERAHVPPLVKLIGTERI